MAAAATNTRLRPGGSDSAIVEPLDAVLFVSNASRSGDFAALMLPSLSLPFSLAVTRRFLPVPLFACLQAWSTPAAGVGGAVPRSFRHRFSHADPDRPMSIVAAI
jgi:hypothetical protein